MGFAMNAYKQNQIFPPPTNPELASNKNQSALLHAHCSMLLTSCMAGHLSAYMLSKCNQRPATTAFAVLKNFLRGALLAFFATFLGVFLFFTLPDLVAGNILRRPMPFWFYENEVRASAVRP